MHSYSDAQSTERLLADLGQPLQVMRVSIKPYACCRYNHGLIDCILQLTREHPIEPDDVERIRLGVLSGGAVLLPHPIEHKREPQPLAPAHFTAPAPAVAPLLF